VNRFRDDDDDGAEWIFYYIIMTWLGDGGEGRGIFERAARHERRTNLQKRRQNKRTDPNYMKIK